MKLFGPGKWMVVVDYWDYMAGIAVLVGGMLILGVLLGWFGLYACVMMIVGIALGIGVVLRLDALTATIVIAIHLYGDWYLGFHLIAPVLSILLLIVYFFTKSSLHPWIVPRFCGLWIIFLVLTIYPAIRGGLLMTYDAASFYPSDILGAFLMYWLGNVIVTNRVRLHIFFVVFTCFAVLLAVHTLYQSITGTILFASSRVNNFLASADVEYYQFTGTTVRRTGSFFIDPNWNGAFFALVLFLPLGLFVGETTFWQKFCALCAMVIILLALMCTYSTGAWCAFIAGCFTFMVFVGKGYYRIVLPMIALCSIGLMMTIFPSQIALQLQHIGANNELSLRIAAWKTALRIIQAYPWMGIGLGHQAYLTRSNLYRVSEQFVLLSHPHDSYLEWAAMAGIPTLIVFVILVSSALWLALCNWRRADMSLRALLGAGIASTITLSINSISINGWTHFALAMIGWLILGVVASPMLAVAHNYDIGKGRHTHMSIIPPMSQNDVEKSSDVSAGYVKLLHRSSLLKDPTTLFDMPSANDRLPFSIDQQLTWLIPAIDNLERIKKMSPFVQKEGYIFLIKKCMWTICLAWRKYLRDIGRKYGDGEEGL